MTLSGEDNYQLLEDGNSCKYLRIQNVDNIKQKNIKSKIVGVCIRRLKLVLMEAGRRKRERVPSFDISMPGMCLGHENAMQKMVMYRELEFECGQLAVYGQS